MKKLVLLALSLSAYAEAPAITDAQRLAYRTLERDYYRVELQLTALETKAKEIQEQIVSRHDAFAHACPGGLDEEILACKEAKK